MPELSVVEPLSLDDLCAGLVTMATLEAEDHGRPYVPGTGKEIIARAVAIDAAAEAIGWQRMAGGGSVHPLYFSIDGEECGFYARADEYRRMDYVEGVLNGLVGAITAEAPINPLYGGDLNWRAFIRYYGVAVVEPTIAVLKDTLRSARHRWVRCELREWPLDEDGDEIVGEGEPPIVVAPIDTDDERFEERGFTSCAEGDEHATQIVQCDIEGDLEPLQELVAKRGRAALAVLRGDVALQGEALA